METQIIIFFFQKSLKSNFDMYCLAGIVGDVLAESVM